MNVIYKKQKLTILKRLAVLTLILTSFLANAAQGVLEKDVSLHFENVSLENVLSQIEHKVDVKFVYSTNVLNISEKVNYKASNVRLEEALNQILTKSGVSFRTHGKKIIISSKKLSIDAIQSHGVLKQNYGAVLPIKGKVTDSNGSGLPGVSVSIKNSPKGTITDVNGNFELDAKAEDILVFSFIGFKSVESPVGGNTSLTIVLQESAALLGEVQVVGSRSTQIRTSTETVAPIDVITAKDLQLTGQVEPTQQIQFTAPSFVSNRQTVADGTDHIDPASLRGLGPDQVLVLVNGKRRYNTSLVNINGTVGKGSVGTDLNAIPASAIERIEVLRDGAASQYGSDAIGGVINIVLKKQLGTTVNTHIGQQYVGDGRTFSLGVNHGIKIGKGVLSLTADFRDRDSTNRAGTFLGTVFNSDVTKDEALIAANGGWNRENNMQVGNSKQRNIQLAANLEMPVGAGKTKFYMNAMYGNRNGKGSGFYRYPKQTTQVVASIYPKGFLPNIESIINDKSVLAGLKGAFGEGWNWDLSSTYGGNSFRFDVTNSNNASLGAQSPTAFYAGTIKFNQSTSNFDISKDFGKQMNLKSFNLALGTEFRVDNFIIEAGDEASWKNYDPTSGKVGGAQVFPGYQPDNALNKKRNVAGVYADIETDLTNKLLVNAAGRFENYSDFGSAFAGKLAVRYKFADAFSVRGTLSNGFRAPSLHQTFFNNTSTQFQLINGATVPSNTLTIRNDSPIARALGIEELKAEKSVNYALGITSRPIQRLSITVDAYQIDIRDRIILAGPFRRTNAVVGPILTAAGVDAAVGVAQAFANNINTSTRGIDIIASTSPRLSNGTLEITFAANFNKTTITDVIGTSKISATPDANGNYFFFDRTEQGRIEMGNPRNKQTISFNYKVGKIGANLRSTRFGQVSSLNANPLLDDSYGAKTLTDLSLNYSITPALRATVGANNLFNIYPDKLKWFREGNGDKTNTNYGLTSDGRFMYSRNATQFGMNGGYYYLNLNFSIGN